MMVGRANWEDKTEPKMSSFERSKRDIADNVRKTKEQPQPQPKAEQPAGGIMRVDKALKDAGVY